MDRTVPQGFAVHLVQAQGSWLIGHGQETAQTPDTLCVQNVSCPRP